MSATATARRGVPVCRTGSRPFRSAAASLCPVPCALWRSGDLPRHRLPRRPFRSRRTFCRTDRRQPCAVPICRQERARVRTRCAGQVRAQSPETVRQWCAVAFPCAGRVRARSDLPPRPCALCRPLCGVIFQGVSSPITAHQTTSNNHGIISGQSRGRFGACPRFKAFQALSRFIKHHQTMKRAKSRHCVPICRTGSRRAALPCFTMLYYGRAAGRVRRVKIPPITNGQRRAPYFIGRAVLYHKGPHCCADCRPTLPTAVRILQNRPLHTLAPDKRIQGIFQQIAKGLAGTLAFMTTARGIRPSSPRLRG